MKNLEAPESKEAFESRLLEITDGLPKRLRQFSDYVARHTDLIAVSTVADLSAASGVQPSAVMRFCQLMGYSGYSQMQKMFRENYVQRWPDYATRLKNLQENGEDSAPALLAEFADAGRASLENLVASIDPDKLEAAVSVLAKAPMIHIVGLNRAFPIATYLSYTLEKVGVPSMLHSQFGKIDQRRAILKDDVLLVITFAPYSEDTLNLAEHAKAQGQKIVAITDAINSPIHRLSATTLTVPEVDVGAFRALTAPMTLAIALAISVGAARKSI